MTGSTTVQITAVNDAPILAVPLVDQTLTANTAFSYTVPTGAFTDPDLETLTYSAVMADGTGMPPWVSFSASTRAFSGTPGTGDIGTFDIRVTAKDSANVSVSDVVRLTVSPPDTAPPTVTSFSPLAEATGVPIGNNIVVTFSEAIAKGIGSIVLKDSTGAAVATYDAATSTNLSISGTTLTINPTADLAYSSGYNVQFAAGSIKDLAGNSYAGTSSYRFYTSAASTTTSVNFDQTADAHLGGIWVHFTVGSESQVWVYGLTYRVGNSQPRLLGQLSGFSYSSPAKLISEGEFVAVTDGNGRYVLIQVTNAQSINHGGPINGVVFSSFIEPIITLLSPLDEQVGVALNSNVVVTFNEPIVQGVGSIVLKTAAGTTVATYDAATSTNLSISGSTLTINPTADLIYSTGYKVEFAAGTIKDLAGNSYPGTTSYNFTTVVAPDTTAPTASTFSPLDEATGIAISSNIVLTFNEAIVRGIGNIVLKTAAGVTVATYDAASSTNLSVTGSTLTINPTSDLINGTGYKVEFAPGTIKDLAGNSYAGTTSYNFTTATLVNSTPTGSVTVTGTPTQGQTLTVSNTLADPDGLGVFNYLWQANGVAIPGASLNSLTLSQDQVGKTITVAVSYSDGHGTAESVASTATATVANINDLPTGGVTISGTATQGQTLTAANTLADADGLGTISYQWKAAGVNIAGATTNTYTLTQAEVGKVITVIASYTDALGTAESKTSTPTSTVAVNQTSTGNTGSTGNDSLTGSSGNDSIDGGAGTDAVVYSGSRSVFSLTKTTTGFTLADSTGAVGTDTLLNVERIKFADGAIALDVGATQPAGQTAMLLGAVLPGRLAFDSSKQALLGAAIDLFDQGYSLQTLSGAVMRLPIWDILTGKATPTSTDIATYLLTNVNGVAPDGTTLATAVAALNTETDFATQGNFLWHLAESSANQTHVGLVGLASTGLAFTI